MELKKLLRRDGEGGVGGRSAFGGAALSGGTSKREEEALRTRTTGRPDVETAAIGKVVDPVSVDDVRVRENVIGEDDTGELLLEGV